MAQPYIHGATLWANDFTWSLKFQALKDQFSAKTQGSFPAAHKEPSSTPYCTPSTSESIPFLQAAASTLGHCSLMHQLQPELRAHNPLSMAATCNLFAMGQHVLGFRRHLASMTTQFYKSRGSRGDE